MMPEDELEHEWYGYILGLIIVAAICIMLLISNAFAHMAERPDLNSWFTGLKSKGGAWCCSDYDGTTLRDAEWESRDGHYRVFMDGEWYDVPDDAVITDPNRYGAAIVWRYKPNKTETKWVIRCFIPGAGT